MMMMIMMNNVGLLLDAVTYVENFLHWKIFLPVCGIWG